MLKHTEIDEEERHSLKRRYLSHMHSHTKCHCFGALFIIFLLSGIVMSTQEFLQGEADFANPEAEEVQALTSIQLARGLVDTEEEYEEAAFAEDLFTFAYEWADGRNDAIITPENLRTFCEIERILFENSDYGFDNCDPNNEDTDTCVRAGIQSVTATVYRQDNATFNYEECYLLSQDVVVDFLAFLDGELEDPSSPFRFYANDLETITITRSLLIITHEDFDTLKEKVIPMEEELFELFGVENTPFKSAYRNKMVLNDIEVTFFSFVLLDNEFERLLPNDFIMAFGSMLFVGIWIGIYTRSLFLTITGTFYILMSIPVSLFIYKILFRILYFDFIHILVIFIILGIGADGTFVAIDAYKQSRLLMDDEYERLVYSWTRSTRTVFNTSFTTAVAFIVTGFTPLIPLSTFGIFAALTIIVNFVFVCTIVHSTIINWERWLVKTDEKEEPDPELKRENSKESFSGSFKEKSDTEQTLKALVNDGNRRFETYYVPFVLKYRVPLTILGFITGILGMVGIAQVSQLTKPENFFPEDHSQGQFLESLVTEFLSGEEEEYAQLDVFWGIKGVEIDYLSRYSGDPDKVEDKVLFDDQFDITDHEAQLAVIRMCELIENKACDPETCLGFSTMALPENGNYQGLCTMREFHTWYNFSEPLSDISSELFNERMGQFLEENPQFLRFIGIINGEVAFLVIQYRITLNLLAPGTQVEPFIELLDEIVDDYQKHPNTTLSAFAVNYASGKFVDYSLELALVETVTKGLAVTFPIVFVVLLLATGNWILAGFSVLTIAFIVITVMGIVFGVIGWELGVAESIVSIMIVGLSVDYAIHLGHMYTVASSSEGIFSREDKFHYAVLTMAPTVLAGGLTTLGAGAFLFGAQITFFGKMGVLLTLTVCCSLFYSVVFLMAFSAWKGPEGVDANLKYPCTKEE